VSTCTASPSAARNTASVPTRGSGATRTPGRFLSGASGCGKGSGSPTSTRSSPTSRRGGTTYESRPSNRPDPGGATPGAAAGPAAHHRRSAAELPGATAKFQHAQTGDLPHDATERGVGKTETAPQPWLGADPWVVVGLVDAASPVPVVTVRPHVFHPASQQRPYYLANQISDWPCDC
jgi:hypothetical protein